MVGIYLVSLSKCTPILVVFRVYSHMCKQLWDRFLTPALERRRERTLSRHVEKSSSQFRPALLFFCLL